MDTLELKFSEPEPRPRTRLRAFATGALVGFVLPALFLAVLPIRASGGRDARQAEGEQLARSLRDHLRVHYAKTDEFRNASQIHAQEFTGQYYHPALVVGFPTPGSAEVFMIPKDDYHPTIRLTFEWASGQGEFQDLGSTWGP